MSRELAKMNLISVVQQLPKEDIETIQGYVEMIEEENEKNKHYKTLYQSLKKQKEELRSWLEEGKRVSIAHENMISVNFISLVLEKMEELESVKDE